ncbi:MAG TPA: FkbM family methyltransferase [Bryobacteraceae bacterium]|nr:FkbM family methyltransferase [Bryobacteraceae bacterium]
MTAKDVTDAHVSLQLFPGYTDADTAIFAEFLNPNAKPEPGFLVDFLGSRIRSSSLWKTARELDGKVGAIPVPADFHAEAIEWIGLLKTVRNAVNEYVAMELGAGFGPWLIAGGVAARLRGIGDIRLCAVEGDSEHFEFLRQHFTDNGFDPDRHTLFQAVVGAKAGVAQWPVNGDAPASEEWGARPLKAGQDYRGLQFQKTKRVDIISMRDLVRREPHWNLIHIDVQGAEVEICRSCIDELSARVRWIIAATHSRKLDGDLIELMYGAGWVLEHEKPAKFSFVPNAASLEAMTLIDGTQVWRNPRLLQGGDPLTSFSQEISSHIHELRAKAGSTFSLDIDTKNTGTQPWFGRAISAPVNASYRWLDGGGNVLPIEGNRAHLNRPVLRPGESDRLKLPVAAPPNPGSYILWVSMVQEGVAWFYDKGAKPLVLSAKVD